MSSLVNTRSSMSRKHQEHCIQPSQAQAQPLAVPDLSRAIEVTSKSYIAVGTFSTIWLGKWKEKYDRPGVVALKAYTGSQLPENKEKIMSRVEREAQSWYNLKHPNVLPLFGICKVRVGGITDSPLLVSPYCQQGTVMEYVAGHPNADKLELVRQVSEGLKYLHSNRILHGDIRGENVFVRDDGQACLADYGQFRLLGVSENAKILYGSAHWIAPELINSPDNQYLPFTTHSDMWSFAMFVLELYTGAKPWKGIRDFTVLSMVAKGQKPERRAYTSVPTAVWNAISLCWSTDPQTRPSIHEITL